MSKRLTVDNWSCKGTSLTHSNQQEDFLQRDSVFALVGTIFLFSGPGAWSLDWMRERRADK